MATQRLTHAQREGMVMQELQEAFPGFVDVPSWASVADDLPDFIGQGPGGSVGLELVEWLDGTQMGVTQAKKAYRSPGISRPGPCRGLAQLRAMVLNAVASDHSKRNYAKAVDEVLAICQREGRPLSRSLVFEYRASMLNRGLSASTVNVRLSALRKLIGEAQRSGMIGAEEAANVAGVPNIRQRGPGWETG